MTATAKPTLAEALVAAQKEMPSVSKDGVNPHFRSKYVSLDSMLSAALPVLNKHGLSLAQFPTTLPPTNGGGPIPALRTRITHVSGAWVEDTMLLVLQKDTPQDQGSALTYARRYALGAILGISTDEDDDGNKAQPKSAPAEHSVKADAPKVSEEGAKKVNALILELAELGVDAPKINARMRDKYGTANATELTVEQANEMIDLLGRAVEEKKEAPA